MMHSSKETCVISYFGVAVAFMLTPIWARIHDEEHPLNRVFRRGESEDLRPGLVRQVAAFVAAGALVFGPPTSGMLGVSLMSVIVCKLLG
mgnify:CR=1 FL=1